MPPTVYGATWCTDCKRTKKFLGEHRLQYTWVDVEQDEAGLKFVEEVNGGKRIIPVVLFEDGTTLVEPSNAQLAAKFDIPAKAMCDFYDLIIIGGGPTGLTAALYSAREGVETLVIERAAPGGQAGITERLDNFPGFPEGIGGGEFADRVVTQTKRFGVEILQAQDVIGIEVDGDYKVVRTENGEYRSRAVLIATGATYRRLGVEGEEELIGAGVHYCATCDGPFYKGQEVVVIGGGNSAGEEGIFLARFASKVTVLVRGDDLTATRIVAEKVRENPQIEVVTNTEVVAFKGHSRLRALIVRDTKTGEERTITPAAAFIYIGQFPNSAFVQGLLADDFDARGFITTDMALQTHLPGVFAAGDVRAGSTKQVASAVGEGATAAIMVRAYLNEGVKH